MMQRRRHIVVIPNGNGGVEAYPLKEWLRQNPQAVPPGLDPTISTSQALRNAMQNLGWTMQEGPAEVRLFAPGTVNEAAIVDDVLGAPDDETQDSPSSPSFSLEAQLRDFLASNLHTIAVDGRKLRLYVDAAGREGIEFPSAVGPIDILATDDEGSLFVFELKRADSPDRVIGQLARYMGWVKQTIGRDREVFGLIVARSVHRNLRYAVTVVPNVSLFEYAVQFTLTPAHELPITKTTELR